MVSYLGQVRKIHLPRKPVEYFGDLCDRHKYFLRGAEFISVFFVFQAMQIQHQMKGNKKHCLLAPCSSLEFLSG